MRHPLLQKYDRLIEFFGQMLGQDYELSLFDLRAEGCPLIFIAGGLNSGRPLGTPLAAAGLSMLERFRQGDREPLVNSHSVTADGRLLRSSAVILADGDDEPEGLLSVRFDDNRYRDLVDEVLHLCHPDHFWQEIEGLEIAGLNRPSDSGQASAALDGELTAAEQQKLDQLKAAQEAAQKALEEAKAALAPVAEKCQEAVSALTAASFIGDAPILPVAPAAGTACPKAELIARVEKALKAAGFMATAADAQTLLTIYALSERMEFCGETEADAQALLEAFAGALGAPVVNGLDKEKIGLVPGGNSPVFIENLGLNGLIKGTGFTLCLTNSLRPNRYDEWADFYESAPFACVALQGALNVIPAPLSPCEAVSRESVRSEMLRESPLNQQTMDAVAALRRALAGLSEEDRELFLRRYYYNQTAEQIAQKKHMNANTVRSRLARGRQALKAELQKGAIQIEDLCAESV